MVSVFTTQRKLKNTQKTSTRVAMAREAKTPGLQISSPIKLSLLFIRGRNGELEITAMPLV